jgi:hypothetical protein
MVVGFFGRPPKARAILGGFLHLSQAPDWKAAMLVRLGLWMAAL